VRADVLSDLLLTGAPALDPTASGDGPGTLGAIRAQVQVIVPALTLLGADEGPSTWSGAHPSTPTPRGASLPRPTRSRACSPIPSTAPSSRSTGTAPRTAAAIPARPRPALPLSRMPPRAIRCEIDHTIDHARGGPTALGNLAHLCQRHHSMKQFTAWTVRQHPGASWNGPRRPVRLYREDAPIPPVAFVMSPAPPPAMADSVPPF
jgi:hypothetical protein